MKKNYLLFGFLYCTLILAIFMGIMYAFSKNKTKNINSMIMGSFQSQIWIYEYPFIETEPGNEYGNSVEKIEEEAAIAAMYDNSIRYYDLTEDIGYYNAVIDTSDYSVLGESRDVIEIMTRRDGWTSTKFALPKEEMAYSDQDDYFDYTGFDDSKCDDWFIYDGKGTLNSYEETVEVTLDHPSYVDEENSISFSSWTDRGSNDIKLKKVIYNKDETTRKINERAKTLAFSYIEKYKKGEIGDADVLTKSGFFVSQAVYILPINNGDDLVVFSTEYKPFMMALKQEKKLYIGSLILFLIIEVFTVLAVRKLYMNQKSFEIRSQKLTRGVAHELKTPLAVTKACVENWEYIDEADRHEYSQKIISEVDHMAAMITKLLELSKLNAGNDTVNKEEVDILALTKKVYSRMDELAGEKNLEVSISGYDDKDEYIVFADPEMMEIVISNFVSNAIKFGETYIKIVISDLGKNIEFRITNDGCRIERKDLTKVWDVFYKSDEGRTDRVSSSGVGLAVVRSILDLHKGKYGCSNSLNSTSFYFLIDKPKG